MGVFANLTGILLKGAIIVGSYFVGKKAAEKAMSMKYFQKMSDTLKTVVHWTIVALTMLIIIMLGFALLNGAFKALEKKNLQAEKNAVAVGNYSKSKGLPARARKGLTTVMAAEEDPVEKRIIALEAAYLAKQDKKWVRKWAKGKDGGKIFNKKTRKHVDEIRRQVGSRYGWEEGQQIGRDVRDQSLAAAQAQAA